MLARSNALEASDRSMAVSMVLEVVCWGFRRGKGDSSEVGGGFSCLREDPGQS